MCENLFGIQKWRKTKNKMSMWGPQRKRCSESISFRASQGIKESEIPFVVVWMLWERREKVSTIYKNCLKNWFFLVWWSDMFVHELSLCLITANGCLALHAYSMDLFYYYYFYYCYLCFYLFSMYITSGVCMIN